MVYITTIIVSCVVLFILNAFDQLPTMLSSLLYTSSQYVNWSDIAPLRTPFVVHLSSSVQFSLQSTASSVLWMNIKWGGHISLIGTNNLIMSGSAPQGW